MENDKPGSEDGVSDDSERSDAGDVRFAKSVTDLMDRIERTAFKRHFSDRELRWQRSSNEDQRASH